MPKDKVYLIQHSYLGEGIYRFKCSVCDGTIDTPLRLSDYFIRETGVLPNEFPLQFCCKCGSKFQFYKYEKVC